MENTPQLEVSSDDQNDDLAQGLEPGASSDRYLITADSSEDDINENLLGVDDIRQRSGTIRSIKKESRRQELAHNNVRESLRARDSFASSDEAGNTSSNSPTVSENESELNGSQELGQVSEWKCLD